MGQGLLVHRYTEEFARHGQVTGQVLLTVDDVTRRSHYRNAQRTFDKLLELGVVPIVNENDTVATSEIRFGDNDRLAALVAHLVHADLLVLLSDVDGLYDAPPHAAGARLIPEVRSAARAGRAPHRQAPARRASAPAACRPSSRRPGSPPAPASRSCSPAAANAGAALAGEETGTLFHPTGRRRPTRLLWLAHATEPKGRIVLDDGAVRGAHRAPRLAAPGRDHRGRRRVRRRGSRRPGRRRRARRRPRTGQLRRRRAARAARPLHPRAGPRAGRGVRARGRPPRRPRAALSRSRGRMERIGPDRAWPERVVSDLAVRPRAIP